MHTCTNCIWAPSHNNNPGRTWQNTFYKLFLTVRTLLFYLLIQPFIMRYDDKPYVTAAARFTVNTKPRFGKCYTCFGCATKPGVVRNLVILQDGRMFSHIIKRVSARAFHWYGWTYAYVEKLPKYAKYYRFIFIPKTGIAFSETEVLFLLC